MSSERLERVTAMNALDTLRPSLLDLEPTPRSVLGNSPKAARATKHDCDFLFGSWKIHNRYLNDRLRHSAEWSEFEARSDVEPVLNGLGNADRFSAVRAGESIEGVTLRLFNPVTREWSIHWSDTVRPGILLPPMVGKFDGKKVLCRFLWTRTSSSSPQWEQAFSDDGGKTWETNWIMEFRRIL